MTPNPALETCHVGLTVRDLDRSLAFYRDLLGLELVERGLVNSPHVGEVVGHPGAELDRAFLRLPNTNAFLELLEYRSPTGTPVDSLHGNPGTCHVAFYTDDLDETWATLKANGSELQGEDITVIKGGVFDGGKVIYCTDPDGIRVEFLQGRAYLDASERDPDAVPKTARANETSHAGIHVSNLDTALEFWVDQLGFEVVAKWVANDKGTREVIGLPTADLKMGMLRLPGTNAFLEVIEYQNAPGRHTVDADHLNPGTCHIALYVDDLESTWERLQSAGAELISTGIVEPPSGPAAGGKVIYCKTHDGFRVEFVQAATYLDGTPRTSSTAGIAA